MGVAFLAAIILIVTLVIAIPCGIAYCVFRWDNRSYTYTHTHTNRYTHYIFH